MFIINKEENLTKNRLSKQDEGIEFIENKGYRIGYSIFIIVNLLIVIFNSTNGLKSYDILCLAFTFFSVESVLKYKFTSKKKYIISSLFHILGGVTLLIAHIHTTLR